MRKYLSLITVPLFVAWGLLSGWAGWRMVGIHTGNRQLADAFEASSRSPYIQGQTMEKMVEPYPLIGTPKLFTHIPRGDYFLGTTEPSDTYTITLEEPLAYYTAVTDCEPALVLEKGTTVLFCTASYYSGTLLGYGPYSLPTYEEGWRYVRPFLEGEDPALLTIETVNSLKWYYIPTASIDPLYLQAQWLRYPPGEVAEDLWDWTQCKEYKEWGHLRLVDGELYRRGVYLSPDLPYPVLDRINVRLLAAASAALLGSAALLWVSRKKKKA